MHRAQISLDPLGIRGESGKGLRADIVRQPVAQSPQARRSRLGSGQVGGQLAQRGTVDRGGVEQPSVLVPAVIRLLSRPQMAAHLPHFLGEPTDPLEQRRVLQVPHDLLPIANLVGIAERAVKEGLQIVFVPSRRHRRDNLVDVQVVEVLGRSGWVVGMSGGARR